MMYVSPTCFESSVDMSQHSQRKKLFAERYAMTNVVRPEVTDGIRERAASVVKQCANSIGGHLDAYVSSKLVAVNSADGNRCSCIAMPWIALRISSSTPADRTPSTTARTFV